MKHALTKTEIKTSEAPDAVSRLRVQIAQRRSELKLSDSPVVAAAAETTARTAPESAASPSNKTRAKQSSRPGIAKRPQVDEDEEQDDDISYSHDEDGTGDYEEEDE